MIRKQPSFLGQQKIITSLFLLVVLLSTTGFLNNQPVNNLFEEDDLPPIPLSESVVQTQAFLDFVETVRDDNRVKEITGFYANGSLNFKVILDLSAEGVVTSVSGLVSEVTSDETFDSIAIEAHSPAGEGKRFVEFVMGQEIVLVKGDGSYERFQINKIDAYQVMDLKNLAGDYRHVETNETLSGREVFSKMFRQNPSHTLIMQTCLQQDDIAGWGRLFIRAKFINDNPVVYVVPTPTLAPTLSPEELELVVKDPLPDKQPTALCRDGWTSYATEEQKPHVCSRHQGLFRWLD